MNKFRSQLKAQKLSLTDAAKAVGISQSYMSEIAAFKKEPPLRVAVELSKVTGGVIPVDYWLLEPSER